MSRVKMEAWGTATVPEDRVIIIPASKLRGLIQLCHPDRHSNSPLSTDMFSYLIQKRKELDKALQP